jgi:hypothetical protein
MKKPRFNMEQHEKMAKELLFLRDRIGQISAVISKAYPFSLGICDQADKAQRNIDEMRNRLDSEVHGENRSMGNLARVYYCAATVGHPPPFNDSELSFKLTK